jgi:chromosome segregation ATPase
MLPTDEQLTDKYNKLRGSLKKHRIVFILGAMLLLFAVATLFLTGHNSNSEIRALNRDIRKLEKRWDSLRAQEVIDSAARADVERQSAQLSLDREAVRRDIQDLASQLQKYKPQYAKVNNYKNVPADSSLLRLFQRHFDY